MLRCSPASAHLHDALPLLHVSEGLGVSTCLLQSLQHGSLVCVSGGSSAGSPAAQVVYEEETQLVRRAATLSLTQHLTRTHSCSLNFVLHSCIISKNNTYTNTIKIISLYQYK